MSATNRVIAGAAGATVAVLAGVAGAISYSHMAELARQHGEVGWRAHAFPVSVDGIEIVASLVLLAHRRAGTWAGWLPWAALATGTAASVAANVAVGASDPVGRLVAGWPAVALLVAIKLLAGLLDAAPADSSSVASPADASTANGGPDGSHGPGPGPVGPGPVPGAARDPAVDDDSGRAGGVRALASAADGGTVPDDLMDAARLVRDRLVASGDRVNRRTLAAGLRAAGHRVRNDRLGELLAVVRSTDDGGLPAVPAGDRSALSLVGGGDRG